MCEAAAPTTHPPSAIPAAPDRARRLPPRASGRGLTTDRPQSATSSSRSSRNQQHRAALGGKLGQHPMDLGGSGKVEPAGDIMGDEHARVALERARTRTGAGGCRRKARPQAPWGRRSGCESARAAARIAQRRATRLAIRNGRTRARAAAVRAAGSPIAACRGPGRRGRDSQESPRSPRRRRWRESIRPGDGARRLSPRPTRSGRCRRRRRSRRSHLPRPPD